jgi:hypothetical protein
MNKQWNESDRMWNEGGIQPRYRHGYPGRGQDRTVSDAKAIYGHLKQEGRETTRIAAKKSIGLPKGVIPDAKRGSVSPLGGVARPEPKRPGLKW